jgi:hypothetical protein
MWCDKHQLALLPTSHTAQSNKPVVFTNLPENMAQTNDQILPAYRRARPQLSCQYCRAGKLKCNRHSPCDSCVKRGRDDLCTYPVPPTRKSKGVSNTKQRIAQLESLVLNLMEERLAEPPDILQTKADSASPSSGHREQPDISALVGQLKVSRGQATSYVGDTHWEAILATVRLPFRTLTLGLSNRLRI